MWKGKKLFRFMMFYTNHLPVLNSKIINVLNKNKQINKYIIYK